MDWGTFSSFSWKMLATFLIHVNWRLSGTRTRTFEFISPTISTISSVLFHLFSVGMPLQCFSSAEYTVNRLTLSPTSWSACVSGYLLNPICQITHKSCNSRPSRLSFGFLSPSSIIFSLSISLFFFSPLQSLKCLWSYHKVSFNSQPPHGCWLLMFICVCTPSLLINMNKQN